MRAGRNFALLKHVALGGGRECEAYRWRGGCVLGAVLRGFQILIQPCGRVRVIIKQRVDAVLFKEVSERDLSVLALYFG